MSLVKKIAKATSMVIILTLASQFLGLFRDMLVAFRFGAGIESDSYVMAQTIPLLIFNIIGVSISTTFIPLYVEQMDGSRQRNRMFLNNLISILTVFSIILVLLGMALSPFLVRIIASGFAGDKFYLTTLLTRIMLPVIFFNTLSYVFIGYLQAEGNFSVPASVGIIFNIVIVLYLAFFTSTFGVYGLTAITVAAMLCQVVYLYIFVVKKGYKYSFYMDLKDVYIKKMGKMVVPVIAGVGISEINVLIDKTMASTLSDGSISALNYSSRIMGVVLLVFVTAITTVIYPDLSKSAVNNEIDKLKSIMNYTIKVIIYMVIPISVLLMVLSHPVIRVLFQRGVFDSKATSTTAAALFYYSIGMVAYGIRDVLSRVFYALKDTVTPMINGAITVAINIGLIIILKTLMGVRGLALAYSLSAFITSALLYFSLRKKLGRIGIMDIASTAVKTLAACVVMGIIAFILNIWTNNFSAGSTLLELVRVCLISAIGIFVYVVMTIILKVQEVNDVLRVIKLKLKKDV